MSYEMPDELKELREWLTAHGIDVHAFKTDRQCAYFAMKLADQRIKFPPRGKPLFPVLKRIQDIVCRGAKSNRPVPKIGAVDVDLSGLASPSKTKGGKKRGKNGRNAKRSYAREQAPMKPVAEPGLAIYCDGACEPNPGPGGWGFAVYLDGSEIDFGCGGLVETTNNQMEMQGLLMALAWLEANRATEPAVILCDSRYVVDGINQWVPKWKANGWRRKSEKAKAVNQEIKNLDLWQLIAAARERLPYVSIGWVKGHDGHLGNERADELSLIGREKAIEARPRSPIEVQLDGGALHESAEETADTDWARL